MTLLITPDCGGVIQKAPYFALDREVVARNQQTGSTSTGIDGRMSPSGQRYQLKWFGALRRDVYRASDEVEQEAWLARLDRAADRLELGSDARSRAADLFLSTLPETDRSKRATMAAALYVGCLLASERRAQGDVADAVGVSRLTVQGRWKDLMEEAGLEPPSW